MSITAPTVGQQLKNQQIVETPIAAPIPVTADGRPQLYWKESTLCEALQISRSVLWQRISEGAYPPPVQIPNGSGSKPSNRWDVRRLLAWMDRGMPHFATWEGRD